MRQRKQKCKSFLFFLSVGTGCTLDSKVSISNKFKKMLFIRRTYFNILWNENGQESNEEENEERHFS